MVACVFLYFVRILQQFWNRINFVHNFRHWTKHSIWTRGNPRSDSVVKIYIIILIEIVPFEKLLQSFLFLVKKLSLKFQSVDVVSSVLSKYKQLVEPRGLLNKSSIFNTRDACCQIVCVIGDSGVQYCQIFLKHASCELWKMQQLTQHSYSLWFI